MAKATLAHLATPGATLELRVTPKASRNEIREEGGTLRVYVTTVPEDGKANAAVQKLLAKALGCRNRGWCWCVGQPRATRRSGSRLEPHASSSPSGSPSPSSSRT